MPESGSGRCPQAERAVDVEPRPGIGAQICDLGECVDRTGVDLTDLGADDGGSADLVEMLAECVHAHAALIVDVDVRRGIASEPEEPQRPVDGHVSLSAHEDVDGRSSREPLLLDVPAGALEYGMASGREAGHVSHLTARDERERSRGRDSEQVLEPRPRDLLDHSGRRAAGHQSGVLVPRRRQPVGSERCGDRATDYEPEVAAARDRDDARLRGGGELLHDVERAPRLVLQRRVERRAELLDRRGRPDGPLVERLDEVGGDLRRAAQQLAFVPHVHECTQQRFEPKD